MDRIFVIDKHYLDAGKEFFSPVEYKYHINKLAPKSFDEISIIDGEDVSALPEKSNILSAESQNICKVVPVGGIPFVQSILAKIAENEDVFDKDMTPLEVPSPLHPFLNRDYEVVLGSELLDGGPIDSTWWFVKDAAFLKSWNSFIQEGDLRRFIDKDKTYVISKKVAFKSEWRAFVFDGEIEGCQNYSGDAATFPDEMTLRKMVEIYSDGECPGAYTLDVGVVAEKEEWYERKDVSGVEAVDDVLFGSTIPIEVHPFVSCGLYGFNSHKLLDMLESGWDWYLQGS